MSYSTPITVVGNVVNTPTRKEVSGGSVVEFRIAVNESRLDPASGEWTERTSFYNVSAWRHLGQNVAECVRKGERMIVTGFLRVREYRTEKDEPRTSVDIAATNIGVDLTYGVARFVKVRRQVDEVVEERAGLPADPMAPSEAPDAELVGQPA